MRSVELEPRGRTRRVAVFTEGDVDRSHLRDKYGEPVSRIMIESQPAGWVCEREGYYMPASEVNTLHVGNGYHATIKQ